MDIRINSNQGSIIYFQGSIKSAKFDSRFKRKQIKIMKNQNFTTAQKLTIAKQTISNLNSNESYLNNKYSITTIDTRISF